MKKLLVLGAAIVVAAGMTVAAASSASSQRSGDLHVTKNCDDFSGIADSFCTITSSSLGIIKVGSRVVYLQDAGAASLDSDVILVVGPGNYALGHCQLDFGTGLGLCTFSGGRGQFKGFRASEKVSHLSGNNWAWDGKYHFRQHDH